jgi:hypothetical protein
LTVKFVAINLAPIGEEGRAMTTTRLGGLRKLEGRRVSLALVGGHRIDDCELMSAASGCRSLWIFRNGDDEFVSTADVVDYWESRS